MEDHKSLLRDSAIVLAAIPAILYTAGASYRNAFLGSMRLSRDYLDRNFHQTVYDGFLQTIGPLFLLACFAVFVGVMLTVKAVENRRKTKGKETPPRLLNFSVVASIFLIFTAFILVTEHRGKSAGEELKSKLSSGKYEKALNITAQINNRMIPLVHITCGERNCAAYEPKTGRIIYYPQSVTTFPLSI